MADYREVYSIGLIERASLIIKAKIVEIKDSTIECAIQKIYKGEHKSDTIQITKFENWTCAYRYYSYEINQEAIFYLEKKADVKYYRIISGGNEGEMPIYNDSIYYKCRKLGVNSKKYQLKTFRINQGYLMGKSFKLREVDSVLTNYKDIVMEIKRKIEDSTILNYYPNNEFQLNLVEEYLFLTSKYDITKQVEWQIRNYKRKRK